MFWYIFERTLDNINKRPEQWVLVVLTGGIYFLAGMADEYGEVSNREKND